MPEPFDLAAIAAAGAPHAQLISALGEDGVALSGHKLVEEGARALLLYVPGLLRVDVKPLEDGLRVVPRPLGGAELGWEIDPSAVTDYGKTAAETVLPALVAFRIALMTGPKVIAGRLLLSYTRAYEHGRTHFVGHVVLRQVDDDG